MNFTKIFEMQKELDQYIAKASNINPEEVYVQRIVALLVELGEFANEYAAFKYWKKNKVIDQAKLVEEFVDGIHFLSSMGHMLGLNPIIEPKVVSQDKSVQLLETFNAIAGLKYKYDAEQLSKAFTLFLGNAELLGITEEMINSSYLEKNKENHRRMNTGY